MHLDAMGYWAIHTMAKTRLLLLLAFPLYASSSGAKPPNVVLIIADDLGWNDVSFRGYKQIPTPNIDRLAAEGMILNSHYSQSLCTPSRVALLTGKYPMRFGLQSGVLDPGERRGIPLKEKILPQYFKELGYATHLIGKWHVGYAAPEMTPTYRGFDSFFGYYSGYIDYYTHNMYTSREPFANGFDLWQNLDPARNYTGQYLTDIFTDNSLQKIDHHDFAQPLFLYVAHMAPHWANENDPVQSPDMYTNRFNHIKHEGRRKYAGVMAALDDSVGKIMNSLKTRQQDDNTVIIFVADNGGVGQERYLQNATQATYGSNWPLRGIKGIWFEGGIRTNAVIWSRLLKHPGTVWNGLMHLTDWLPTLMTVAGGMPVRNVDGVDQWMSLVEHAPSMRNEFLAQADARRGEYALRMDQYKLIIRDEPIKGYDAGQWYEPYDGLDTSYIDVNSPGLVHCEPPKASDKPCLLGVAPCLFDIQRDPCERNNIAHDYPDVMNVMLDKLRTYNASAMHPARPPHDPLGLASHNGGDIAPWLKVSELSGFLVE